MPEPVQRLILRDARVVDPTQGLDEVATVFVEKGQIAHVSRGADEQNSARRGLFAGAQSIDAKGLVVAPGFIDLRCHLGEPGYEYKEDIASGLNAAKVGGYVRVCCLPDTKPVNDCRPVTESLLQAAQRCGGTQLSPIAAVTRELKGEVLAEVGDQKEAGAVAVSDANHYIRRSDVMRCALQYCQTFDLVLMQQAQDPTLARDAQMHEGGVSTRLGLRGWPRVAEEVALFRDLALAEDTGARYHASTISTQRSVELVREAKSRGLAVSCDITPYHLLLNEEQLHGYDARYKLVPPLRTSKDQQALLEAVLDGTIDCVVSDHRPQSALETNCEFDQVLPGMSGLELCVSVLWKAVSDGRIPVSRLVELLSTNPAKVLGLEPPSLKPGAPANLALLNTSRRFVPAQVGMQSKSSNTPYLDQELSARVVMTIANGHIIHTSKEEL